MEFLEPPPPPGRGKAKKMIHTSGTGEVTLGAELLLSSLALMW